MGTDDLKRTLDEAIDKLKAMHHSMTVELQKADEAEQGEYVQFLETQLQAIDQISTRVEAAMNTKQVPFI